MTGWVRLPTFVGLALIFGVASASAQSVGADEAVSSHGLVAPTIGLTPEEKSAIYNAIVRQRVRASSTRIESSVGTSVPRSVALDELPGQISVPEANFLKYAMVADDVVVVDQITMHVVDVIHGNTGP